MTAGVPEVIVIEDDPVFAELLRYSLTARGYQLLVFRNGREALAQLQALDTGGARPLVLLNVDLPGLDGFAVLEALNATRPGVFRPVFFSAHGSEDDQVRGLQAGAIDYVVKPVAPRVLLEKIRIWVGR